MRRMVLAAAIVAAATMAPAGAQGASGDAFLRGFACHRSLDPSKRSVTVTAVMGTIAGTQRLQMRFALVERTAHGQVLIHGGDLGQWISPTSSTLGQHASDKWVVNHPVTGVPVPGSYHFKVWFRWIGGGGQVIGRAQRATATCRQPDLRPNLYVKLFSSSKVSGGERYTVQVGNNGLTGATGVEVAFSAGGSQPAVMKTIARLPSHQSVQRSFVGPSCTSSSAPATITVDPNDLIDEVSRADNSITVPCPSG
jgi:F0F1-type ATP synthase membrane subunit c/vacuolar-type H+-ATPase subunit K